MEITKELLKSESLKCLYSYENIKETVEDIEYKMLDKAQAGLVDLLIYKSDYNEIEFWVAIKVLKLKGYNVTQFGDKPEIFNINWEN